MTISRATTTGATRWMLWTDALWQRLFIRDNSTERDGDGRYRPAWSCWDDKLLRLLGSEWR